MTKPMKPIFNSRDLAVTQACVATLFFLMIPLFNLMGISSYTLSSVLHGLGATMTVMISCYSLHQVYPLLRRKEGSAAKLEFTLWLTNVLILATIITANWLYIGYRAPDSGQQWLLYHNPIGHTVMMEFKEFVSLFPLPLGVAAAWILRRFRNHLSEDTGIASVIAILVTLMWICLIIGFVLGIGLAKLRMV
jgi:hypothetical protein